MTGTSKKTKAVSDASTDLVNGILSGSAWSGTSITYAFPSSASSYSYKNEVNNNFGAVSSAQKYAARFALDQSYGTSANDGFSLEGFTNLGVSEGSQSSSNIRIAQSDEATPTAYATIRASIPKLATYGSAHTTPAPVAITESPSLEITPGIPCCTRSVMHSD